MLAFVIKIVIIFAIANQALGFKANSFFHLFTIDKGSTITRATYNIYQINDAPFDIFSYTITQLIHSVDQRNHSKKQYNLIINFEDKVFDLISYKTDLQRNPIDGQYHTFLDFDYEDVLSTIFKCKIFSQTYVSRFLYLEYENHINYFNVSDPTNVPFLKKIYTFWTITRKNSIKYDNEINYEKFLEDCHQSSYNYGLISLGLILVMISLGAATPFLYKFLRKRKIFPY